MMRAEGWRRRARRIAWRAWRSASAVTAQVLTMTASLRPALAAARRMSSDSNAFSRHPKVMISLPCIYSVCREQIRVERAFEAYSGGPGHNHMPVLPPGDAEYTAVEFDAAVAVHQPAAMRGDERRARAAAAGSG